MSKTYQKVMYADFQRAMRKTMVDFRERVTWGVEDWNEERHYTKGGCKLSLSRYVRGIY